MADYFLKFNDFSWTNTEKGDYKPANDSNLNINEVTVQKIVENAFGTRFHLNYFECNEKGFTNLDKHEHAHVVIITRGKGKVIIDKEEISVKPMDILIIPNNAAHQFINTNSEPFGFFSIN